MRPTLVALVTLAASCSEPPPRLVVVRAGRLIDGTGAAERTSQRIVIEDGLIAAVTADEGALPSDARVIDAVTSTVLPGLIDPFVPSSDGCSAKQIARGLRLLLDAGFTSLGDADTSVERALALRAYVGTGRSRGPRMFVGGPTMIAGQGAAPEHIHARAEAGVDLASVTLSEDTCDAIAEIERQDLVSVVRTGDATLAAQLVACSPDVIAWTGGTPPAALAHSTLGLASWPRDATTAALVNEGKVSALGGIASPCAPEAARAPLEILARAGASPPAVLRALTSGAARAIGMSEALGRVAVGYRADLVAVNGTPDQDLAHLTRVDWVMVDGVVQHTEPRDLRLAAVLWLTELAQHLGLR